MHKSSHQMTTAMRQLGRPLGKSLGPGGEGRPHGIMAINRRRVLPHEGPPAAPGHADRTAGGLGGAAPASLDLYGQSSILTNRERWYLHRSRLIVAF